MQSVVQGDHTGTNGVVGLDRAGKRQKHTTQLIVHLPDRTKSLVALLKTCEDCDVKVGHLETRPARIDPETIDIFMELSASQESHLKQAIAKMPGSWETIYPPSPLKNASLTNGIEQHLHETKMKGYAAGLTAREEMDSMPDVPWFPTTLLELIEHGGKTLQCGEELHSDHPSFSDDCYRARRKTFTDISNTYILGHEIPRVEYTKEENETWCTVYRHLTSLYPSHACSTYNENFKLLEKHCGFSDKGIPQMEDVSNFLRSRTGFRLRPITGLVDWRDYLGGLAFRVFHATQYIRHHTSPQYTPEPDICHEYLGHVALFCDPEFALFSQELGLASLGAPDEWVEKLGSLYWYTVEMGLCREMDHGSETTKAYGGALLSSFSELEHCLTDKAVKIPLDPEKVVSTPYPITRFQDVYFVAESFKDVRDKLASWITQIPRPFSLRYNAYTQSVEILHKKEHLTGLVRDIETDIRILKDTITKLK